MNVVALVQARMSSSRLPGKVLLPIAKKPVLLHIVERLSWCRLKDKIVVVTSTEESDKPIVDLCNKNKIGCFQGSLSDVLDRFYSASIKYKADAIVRITADCPVIDPIIVDTLIEGFLSGNYDCFGLGGDFPDGLDCTVYSFSAIKKAWEESELESEREHVGPYIENNKEIFKVKSLEIFEGLYDLRLTLDEPEDYELLSNIFDHLYNKKKPFLTHQVLSFIKANSSLKKINENIIRNQGYLDTLAKEKEQR